MIRRPPRSTLFPLHDALPISARLIDVGEANIAVGREMLDLARANIEGNRDTNAAMAALDSRMSELLRFTSSLERDLPALREGLEDRKSTRLNSSHANISYAVF